MDRRRAGHGRGLGRPRRALPRTPGGLQDPEAVRTQRRAAAADRLREAAAQGARVSFDAEAYRERSLSGWEDASGGWIRHREELRRWGEDVSQAMIEAVAPGAGERVLELAAGLGETGMLAAELVAPVGSVVISDQAEGMVEGA